MPSGFHRPAPDNKTLSQARRRKTKLATRAAGVGPCRSRGSRAAATFDRSTLTVLLAICGKAGFAAWPDRTIRLVVPFPPDGPVDLVEHIIAPKLGERLPNFRAGKKAT